jgi:hypothetical protein
MTLQFEGDAVDAGAMDVRQLAPALLATAEAMREAHQILRLPGPAPQVEVRATRPGSFVVDLILAEPSIFQRAVNLLSSDEADAATNLAAVVGWFIGSIRLVKQLRGRKVRSTEQPGPELIRLVLADGTVIETTPQSFQLVIDASYRKALCDLVDPLRSGGIRALTASNDGRAESVTQADVAAFEVPPAVDEQLVDTVTEAVIRPVNVAFAEGNKWRFSDGDSTFFAAIEDPDFVRAVELGTARFAKNDMLRVRLRTRQYKADEGLRVERIVIQVLDHISGARQLDLFTTEAAQAADK